MAHFYGSVTGSAESQATRTGTPRSGLSGHLRGWNTGARVTLEYDEEAKQDVVKVYRTGGSNGHGPEELMAEWRRPV